ncbi:HemK methyltransferase member 2 [Balamuthia mandrillaris]
MKTGKQQEESKPKLPTPNLAHFTREDYEKIYEPAEDTFLFLDALEAEQEFLTALRPNLCLELGSGSGCVICFLASMLKSQRLAPVFLAIDVNHEATFATQQTAKANNVSIEGIRTDLFTGLEPRLHGLVDVLLFNPPYVPSEAEEVGTRDVCAAWAGGKDGREVLDRVLPLVANLLSERGVFYLVAIDENNPKDIRAIMSRSGFASSIVLQRRAFNEQLYIIKFQRRHKKTSE